MAKNQRNAVFFIVLSEKSLAAQGFHGILAGGNTGGKQTCEGGQHHADQYQCSTACPGELCQIGDIRQVSDNDVGGDAEQEGHNDAQCSRSKADDKGFRVENTGDISLGSTESSG